MLEKISIGIIAQFRLVFGINSTSNTSREFKIAQGELNIVLLHVNSIAMCPDNYNTRRINYTCPQLNLAQLFSQLKPLVLIAKVGMQLRLPFTWLIASILERSSV